MRAALSRICLFIPLMAAINFGWYALRWNLGDTMAEFAPGLEQGGPDIARTAERLAPDDPLPYWVMGGLQKNSFVPEDLALSVTDYEKAVSKSPNDYRLWMDLGEAREHVGDRVGAETALRRAVELAPYYAYPRWYLGNLLLREGRSKDAFAELQQAGNAGGAEFAPQVLNLAWYIYDGDVPTVLNALGSTVDARARLIAYLLARRQLDQAMQLWSGMSGTDKQREVTAGQSLMDSLVGAKRYRDALQLYHDLWPQAAGSTVVGQFVNPGLETDVGAGNKGTFGWQIRRTPEAQVAVDASVRHSGARSLRVSFNAPSNLVFDNIAQLVVVEPSSAYRFECFVKSENLKSAATPILEIVDMTDGKVLGATPPLPVGRTDWHAVSVDFYTSAGTQAVTIRSGRPPCEPICPIFGVVWYDDFSLERISGTHGSR